MSNTENQNGSKSSDESEVLWAVLDLIPELRKTARLAILARKRCNYPLTKHEDFLQLADPGKDFCDLGNDPVGRAESVTMEQAIKHFPEEFFPVEDEESFIARVYMAFLIGRDYHFKHTMSIARRPDLTSVDEGGKDEPAR